MKSDLKPFTTVCVPSIGASMFLDETLASIKAAWTEGMELVLLDNASASPLTQATLARHALMGRVVRMDERVPIARSWNTALRVASGEWLHLLHDDDWVEPDFYRSLQADTQGHADLGVWFCSTKNVSDSCGTPVNYVAHVEGGVVRDLSEIGRMVFERNLTRCVGTVINTAVARHAGGFDESMRHHLDVEFFWRCACEAGAYFEPSPLGHYRIHPGSLTQHQGRRRRQTIIEDGRLQNDVALLLEKYAGDKIGDPAPRRYAAHALAGIFRYHLHRMQLMRAFSAWTLAHKHGIRIAG
jgi:glycosyltransferase involved in cell wall biosynthesis